MLPEGKYLEKTTPVGSYPPNAWGLYDMHGNVWEWCMDWYGEKYYDECKKKGVVENPAGSETGSRRVLRGGSWNSFGLFCRSALRYDFIPVNRNDFIGHWLPRCVRPVVSWQLVPALPMSKTSCLNGMSGRKGRSAKRMEGKQRVMGAKPNKIVYDTNRRQRGCAQ
ncbi:MAG: formylglycine-generating enzyme family protein [Desulfobacterales bacterium]|nr:formylglycine-generating enzyme family protein [Desulfobacterales bacterium]